MGVVFSNELRNAKRSLNMGRKVLLCSTNQLIITEKGNEFIDLIISRDIK